MKTEFNSWNAARAAKISFRTEPATPLGTNAAEYWAAELKDAPEHQVPIGLLKPIVDNCRKEESQKAKIHVDASRVEEVNFEYPIIVVVRACPDGEYTGLGRVEMISIVDGLHRTTKAIKMNKKTINAKFLPIELLRLKFKNYE